jgi:hypothetical protein
LAHKQQMKTILRNPVAVFFIAMAVIAAILFFIPVNLFDGEVIYKDPMGTYTKPLKLSLSYFIGIGVSPADLKDVVGFRLVGMGYLLAFLIIFALPLLIAYRVRVANQLEKRKGEDTGL